jgi:hypothetical protein
MKFGIVVNVFWGIVTELLYAGAIILTAVAACLVFSMIKP